MAWAIYQSTIDTTRHAGVQIAIKIFLYALLLVPCLAFAQSDALKNFVVSPPYDGSRNSFFSFYYTDKICEGYSGAPKDIVVTRTSSGFELAFNVRTARVSNCFDNRMVERALWVPLPFVLPDTPLPSSLTLSVRLGDGRRGSISLAATPSPRARTVPSPPSDFTWSVNGRTPQFVRAYVGETESRYQVYLDMFPESQNGPAWGETQSKHQIYPDTFNNRTDYCLLREEKECFQILVCEQYGDIGLGRSQFGNNSPSCGRGAKRHLVFMGSPTSLSIVNEDGTGFSAQQYYGDLSGRWQIVDPLAPLKYGANGIVVERALVDGSRQGESYRFSGSAGEGVLFVSYPDAQLALTKPARGNRGMQLNFSPSGITSDRIYRFTPFPDASLDDLALGHYAGLGTWTLIMVRE